MELRAKRALRYVHNPVLPLYALYLKNLPVTNENDAQNIKLT